MAIGFNPKFTIEEAKVYNAIVALRNDPIALDRFLYSGGLKDYRLKLGVVRKLAKVLNDHDMTNAGQAGWFWGGK